MRNVVRGLMASLWLASATVALAQDLDIHVRSFDHFEFDADVYEGMWVETFGGYSEGTTPGVTDNRQGLFGVRLVQGWKLFEAGVEVPWLHNEPLDGDTHSGIGDTTFYGKIVPLQTEFVNLGGGAALSAPTGNEGDGLGVGDLGIRPFVTTSLQLPQVQLRAHVAYAAYSNGGDDGVTYGGGLFIFANAYLNVRAEFVGEKLDHEGTSSPVAFEPGVDFHFLFPEVDAWFRPTGLVGITDDAPDWGVFASIVISRTPGWVSR